WMPAPPPESEPAMVRAHNGRESMVMTGAGRALPGLRCYGFRPYPPAKSVRRRGRAKAETQKKARETRAFLLADEEARLLRTPASARRRSCYQITTCWSAPRTIGWPGLHENAAANAGRFDGAPTARNRAGA